MTRFDYVSVEELARMTDRSSRGVQKMIASGILSECGYIVRPIFSKRNPNRIRKYAIGVPYEDAAQERHATH